MKGEMRFEYDPLEKVPAGTIVYPEIEALRYLIAEQKKEIELLRAENMDLKVRLDADNNPYILNK